MFNEIRVDFETKAKMALDYMNETKNKGGEDILKPNVKESKTKVAAA